MSAACCDPGSNPPVQKPPGGTRLITDPSDPPKYTAYQDTDTRTALTRGLAEYLRSLSYQTLDGRLVQLIDVFGTWPEAEQKAQYPSALVYTQEPGIYDSTRLGGPGSGMIQQYLVSEDTYLVSPAEFAMMISVEVYCTEPQQRAAISLMIEQGLSPVDFMYGCRLELPHYFNERATYEMVSHQYMDDEVSATQRFRKVVFKVKANTPYTRAFKRPLAKVKVRQDEVSPDAILR